MIMDPSAPPSATPPSGRKPHILLVDDERLVLATLARGLERNGYDVVAVASKAEALAAHSSRPAELAVLDVRLAEGTGLDLARELSGQRPVPVIFLSAFDDREYIDRAVAEWGFAYLVKPVTPAQLAPVIETVLARGREFTAVRDSEESLRAALARERQVSIAVGLLMERARLCSRDAFEILRSRARSERRRVVDVAEEMVRSVEGLNELARAARDPGRPPGRTVK